MDVHVFCGPEFVLEVPPSSVDSVLEKHANTDSGLEGLRVRDDCLLRMQTELFGVCTVTLRHLLHGFYEVEASGTDKDKAGVQQQDLQRGYRHCLNSGNAALDRHQRLLVQFFSGTAQRINTVPRPLSRLALVSAVATNELSDDETKSMDFTRRMLAQEQHIDASSAGGSVYVLVKILDSRVASELFMVALKNGCLAVLDNCRLLNYFRASARGRISLSDVLSKKELIRSHYGLDDDLWEALEKANTSTLEQQLMREAASSSGGRMLSQTEEHNAKVRVFLGHCESAVTYAAVLDQKEEASPFLVALALFHRLRLTVADLILHLCRHPRRVIRALALYIARYSMPPEHLAPIFLPCLRDMVEIACSEGTEETCAVSVLCEDLLLKTEVHEAWLPPYHLLWKEEVVLPGFQYMQHLWDTRGAAPEASTSSGIVANADPAPPILEAKGRGRGVGERFGFKSLQELQELVKERTLAPQRMATLIAKRRRSDWDTLDSTDEAVDAAEEEDDGFLIDVAVADAEDAADVPSGGWSGIGTAATNRGGVGASVVSSDRDYLVDPYQVALREGQRTVLSLLGRTQPANKNCPHYLDF